MCWSDGQDIWLSQYLSWHLSCASLCCFPAPDDHLNLPNTSPGRPPQSTEHFSWTATSIYRTLLLYPMSITCCALPVNNSNLCQHHLKMCTNVLCYSLHYSQVNRMFRFPHCINWIYNETFSVFLTNTRLITTH